MKRRSTGLLLWKELLKHLKIRESQYFGIQYRDSSNQKLWLDLTKSLRKQLEGGGCDDSFHVGLRVKLWPTDPNQVTDDLARCLMVAEVYEQLQSGRLQCSRNSLVMIGGLTLQSQLSDYDGLKQQSGYASQFFICRDQHAELEAEMEEFHQSAECRGLKPSECDRSILQLARRQPLYGVHQCGAMDHDGLPIELGVCCKGLVILKHNVVINKFKWSCVKKSFVEKKVFFVELVFHDMRKQIGFQMATKIAAKGFWKLFVECHAFYADSSRKSTSLLNDATVDVSRWPIIQSLQSLQLCQCANEEEEVESSPVPSVPSACSLSLTVAFDGAFDLQSTVPHSSHQSEPASIRRCALFADEYLYESQSRVSPGSWIPNHRAVSRSPFGTKTAISDGNLPVVPERLERTDVMDVCADCDTLQRGEEDEGFIDHSLGWTTPDGTDIPAVHISQLVRKLSEEEKDLFSCPGNFIACELRDTERSYCADLQLLNVQFRTQVVKSQLLSPIQVSELFSNLSLIQEFSKDFLVELEARIASCKSYPEHCNYRIQIGDILRKRMAYMTLYTSYVKRESKIFELMRQWQQVNSDFRRLCSRFECDEACNRPVSELFYRPFQRMIHYRELIKRLLDHSEDQTDRDDLKGELYEALNHLEKALDHVNESTRAAQNTRRMIRIQRDVIGVRNVLQPGRSLITEGTLLRIEPKAPQLTHFFLFSDVLLYAVQKSSLNGAHLVARGALPLAGMKVEAADDSEKSNSTPLFKICSEQTSFVVIAENTRDKRVWIDSLKQCIMDCERSGTSSYNAMSPSGSRCVAAGVVNSVNKVKKCMNCSKKFHIFRRRYRCGRCYKVVCRNCLCSVSPTALVEQMEPVCLVCYSEAIRLQALPNSESHLSRAGVDARSSKRTLAPRHLVLSKISSAIALGSKYDSGRHFPVQTVALSETGRTLSVGLSSSLFDAVGVEVGSPDCIEQNASSPKSSRMLLSTNSHLFCGDSEMSGYLFCRSRGNGGWKQFWVVVSPFSLQHYKKHDDSLSVSSLAPSDYELAFPDVNDVEAAGCMFVFKLSWGSQVLFYLTESKFALARWTELLSSCVKRSRVHRQLGHLSKYPSEVVRLRSYTVC